METQSDTLKEILGELFALLETQETNSTAVLQLLKDQGIASDEKLSTYLDQAGKASNVKWRAARMRMEYLLTPIQKETAGSDKSKQPEPKESQPPEAAHKLEEEQPNSQAKDNAKEKGQKEAPTKSASKDVAEKSGDPKRDASNGAPTNNQRTSSKQTA
jgi:hypothetical protein